MATRPHHEAVEDAVWHLRALTDRDGDPEFRLEMGLSALLSIRNAPSSDDYRMLLAAILSAHAEAISQLDGQIDTRHINEGMGAAFLWMESLFHGETDSDRHHDAGALTKVMIHRCRIAQHEQDIEKRRRVAGQKHTIFALLPNASSVSDEVFL